MLKKSLLMLLFAISIGLSFLFQACTNTIDEGIREEIIPSPFFLELNQQGVTLDIQNNVNIQAKSDVNFDEDLCDWFFESCNLDGTPQPYFAASFGNSNLGIFNFIFTYFTQTIAPDIENCDSNPSLAEIFATIPMENNNIHPIAINEGTETFTGNAYIGKNNYKMGFRNNQLVDSKFKILEVNEEVFEGQNVLGIRLEFVYRIFNEEGDFLLLSNGNAYLPFGLHGRDLN